jgi:hypothetical protein
MDQELAEYVDYVDPPLVVKITNELLDSCRTLDEMANVIATRRQTPTQARMAPTESAH